MVIHCDLASSASFTSSLHHCARSETAEILKTLHFEVEKKETQNLKLTILHASDLAHMNMNIKLSLINVYNSFRRNKNINNTIKIPQIEPTSTVWQEASCQDSIWNVLQTVRFPFCIFVPEVPYFAEQWRCTLLVHTWRRCSAPGAPKVLFLKSTALGFSILESCRCGQAGHFAFFHPCIQTPKRS